MNLLKSPAIRLNSVKTPRAHRPGRVREPEPVRKAQVAFASTPDQENRGWISRQQRPPLLSALHKRVSEGVKRAFGSNAKKPSKGAEIKAALRTDRKSYHGEVLGAFGRVAHENATEQSISREERSHQVSDDRSSSVDHPETPTRESSPRSLNSPLLDEISLDDPASVVASPSESPIKTKDKSEHSPSTAKPADSPLKEKDGSENSDSTGSRVIDFHLLCVDFSEVNQALKEAHSPAVPGATYETEFDAATRDSYDALDKTCLRLHGAQFKPPAGMEWFASGRLNAYVHALCAALPSEYRQIKPNVTWEFRYDVKEELIVANFSVELSPKCSLKGGFEFSVDSVHWWPLNVTIHMPAAPLETPTRHAPVSKVSAAVIEEQRSLEVDGSSAKEEAISDSKGADQVALSAAEIAEREFDTLKEQKAAAIQKKKSVGRLIRKKAQKALDVAEVALSKEARATRKRDAGPRFLPPVDWTIGTCLGTDDKGYCPVNKGEELPFLERIANDQCDQHDDSALMMMRAVGSWIPSFKPKSYAQGLLDSYAVFGGGRTPKDANTNPLPGEMMGAFRNTALQEMGPGEWLNVLIFFAARKEKCALPSGFPAPSKKAMGKAAIWNRLAAEYRMKNLCSARSYTLAWEAMDRNIEANKLTEYRPASQASEEAD